MGAKRASPAATKPWPPSLPWRRLTPKAKHSLLILVLAGIFCAFFLSFPNLVRDFLVDPALRLFLILDSFPQTVVWLLVLGVLVLGALRFFHIWSREPIRRRKAEQRIPATWEVLLLVRRSRYSPWARRTLRQRLSRIAVAIRTEREPVTPEQAWQDLWSRRWPRDGALARFLHGEDNGDFEDSLSKAVDELLRYAQGGGL